MSNLKDLQKRALIIANHYDGYNRRKGRKTWEIRDYTEGLVGDIGDLVKAVMGVMERRDMEDAIPKVQHELNDIMWSLLILYKFFELDPDESFMKAMDALELRVIAMKSDAIHD